MAASRLVELEAEGSSAAGSVMAGVWYTGSPARSLRLGPVIKPHRGAEERGLGGQEDLQDLLEMIEGPLRQREDELAVVLAGQPQDLCGVGLVPGENHREAETRGRHESPQQQHHAPFAHSVRKRDEAGALGVG